MGIAPCPLPSSEMMKSQFDHYYLHSHSSTSLSSQQSLPSVPSLTSQFSQQHPSNISAQYQCISTLKGHSSYVFSLVLSGKFLYSGSSDRETRVWSTHDDPSSIHNNSNSKDNNNVISEGISGAVKSLVVSGNKLFSAHQDHKIRVWQIDTQKHNYYKKLATLPTLSDRVMKLLPTKNYVQVRRHKKFTWVHHVDAVSALAISADGSLLYSVSWDRALKIWRISDFKCLESVSKAHDDAINAIALSRDGYVYTGSADKKINVWKKGEGDKKHSLLATLQKHESAVNALVLSPDGSILYSGACDRSIVVWEKDGGGGHMVVVGALRGHSKAILCLAVVEDLIFSGSADKTVRIWRRGADGRYLCLGVLEGHGGPVKCLAVAADHDQSCSSTSSFSSTHADGSSSSSFLVYSGSLDCDIRVWRVLVPCNST